MSQTTINISWQTIWRVFAALVLAVVLYLSYQVLFVLLLGIIISSALDGAVTFLEEKWKIPRILGTLAIFLLGIFIIFFILYNILPLIFYELYSLLKTVSVAENGFWSEITRSVEDFSASIILPYLGKITESLLQGSFSIFSAIKNIFGNILLALSVLIISFYLTLSRDGVGRFLRSVFPEKTEDYILEIYYRAKQKIGRWLQAQILLSLSVGLLVYIGLSIIGIRHALLIAVLAAAFELIPIVGPIFSGLIAVLVAFTTTLSLPVILWALIVFLVIQFLESNVLVPLFMHRAVHLHPVVVIAALMIGSQVFGIIGMVLAVPLVVVTQEIIEGRPKKKAPPLPML